MTVDLAGKQYWDQIWAQDAFPPDIDPDNPSIWSHRDRVVDRTLQRIMNGRARGLTMVELGCARSAWLPYFARHFGCRVSGLDYSEIGAEQTAARLREADIPGDVRCANLFDPPAEWIEAFDLVSWFGVVEHFKDTTEAIRAASRLLKPGGLMITEIPNLTGVTGRLQRSFNKPIYDIHVPMDARELAARHEAAGLRVVNAEYVVPMDFGILNIDELPSGFSLRVKEKVLYVLRLFGGCVWWLDRRIGPFKPGRLTSGYVFVSAEKLHEGDAQS